MNSITKEGLLAEVWTISDTPLSEHLPPQRKYEVFYLFDYDSESNEMQGTFGQARCEQGGWNPQIHNEPVIAWRPLKTED